MKTASVIMLSYNSPDIYCAINSVLTQSYNSIQLIIVDDRSDNFDEKAVRDFVALNNRGNVTVDITVNTQNLGTIKASNIALSKATGEYIINLAGDDRFYDNDVVSDIVDEFERTGALVLTGLRSVCDSTLENELAILPDKRSISMLRRMSSQQLFEAMAGCNFIFGCCTARTRTCVEKYGSYDERYRLLDDYTMNMKLLRQGVKITFYDRIFVKYRSGGVSAADRINDSYFSESDSVFQNEILPYSVNPTAAKRKYLRWKREVVIRAEYLSQKNAASSKVHLMVVKVMYCMCHPVMAVKGFCKRYF